MLLRYRPDRADSINERKSTMKKYIKSSFIYAIIAMALGVFYREYTQIIGFSGETRLSVMHTHYFVLGMIMFLIFALLEERTAFSNQKFGKSFQILYHIGLNLSGAMLFTRGMVQVATDSPTRMVDMAISGISGLGHIVLGVAIILFFLAAFKTDKVKKG